jgi:hypothetical protein
MTQMGRIARSLIADLPESPRIDFWTAVLYAMPEHRVKLVGEMLEERSDNPIASRVLESLERRFASLLDALGSRYSKSDLETALIQRVRNGVPIDRHALPPSIQMISITIDIIGSLIATEAEQFVTLSLNFGHQRPVGELQRGAQFFRNPDDVWTVVGKHESGAAYVQQVRGMRSYNVLPAATLVYPLTEFIV